MNKLNIEKIKSFKLVLFFFLLLMSVSFIVAYLSDADNAENVMTVGNNVIEIVEKFDPPKEIAANVSFTKDVKVKNSDGCDCYVRVKAVFENSHMEQYCKIDWNNSDWKYNTDDGYWYYTKLLSKNDLTSSLFTTVTINSDIPKLEITDFNIIIYAESVESLQGKGFDSYVDAWKHYQKNKKIS